MGRANWKEEAQSTETGKWGGEEVNRRRGEICVTAAAWGSPTEQRGMLLMDMSDIVLTSSLWIVQHTQHTTYTCENVLYSTQTHYCISILERTHNYPITLTCLCRSTLMYENFFILHFIFHTILDQDFWEIATVCLHLLLNGFFIAVFRKPEVGPKLGCFCWVTIWSKTLNALQTSPNK